jgi:hypothetical protein
VFLRLRCRTITKRTVRWKVFFSFFAPRVYPSSHHITPISGNHHRLRLLYVFLWTQICLVVGDVFFSSLSLLNFIYGILFFIS